MNIGAGGQVSARVEALDIFRGLVMFVLVPNTTGGFGFFEMARQSPDNPVWSVLGRWFTHAVWSGATPWDLVMPCFVFMAGMAMTVSAHARRQHGEAEREIVRHVALRTAALFLLGMNLLLPFDSWQDVVWPMLMLSTGLPWSQWLTRRPVNVEPVAAARIQSLWMICVLAATAIRLGANIERLGNYNLSHLLMQIALAYPIAFYLARLAISVQIMSACGLLLVYWLAFRLYPLPPAGLNLAEMGVNSPAEVFTGVFAHWNKNTKVAAAFDMWFLNALPRHVPFVFEPHGYQTLTFVPTAVNMLVGAWAGRAVLAASSSAALRKSIWIAGAAGVAFGWWLGTWWCPLVKSIWTPSWVVFSSGWALLLFALCMHLADGKWHRALSWPLVAVGCNSLLLYVLAMNYRWYLVAPWAHLAGGELFFGYWQPILASLACLLSLAIGAAVLHRLRIHIRL